MSGPEKWGWDKSNGNATAAETAVAYAALTTGGRTRAFTSTVWNDIIEKISAQRVFWTDTNWDESVLKKADVRMSHGANMTAARFNSAVRNMPPIKTWPWEATLERTDIRQRDRCYGAYFVYLTDGLNYWIDLVPIPFGFSNSIVMSADLTGHVCPSIHIMFENSAVWMPNVKAHVAPSAPVKYSLRVTHTGELRLETLNVTAVRIVNFAHVDMANTVTMYPATHVIASLNAELQHRCSVTFGNIVFLQVQMPFTYSPTVNPRIDTALHFGAGFDVGEISAEMAVHLAQRCYFAFDLVSKMQCNFRVRELDSEPITASLDIASDLKLALMCQSMERIVINLAEHFFGNIAVSSVPAIDISILLQCAYRLTGQLATPGNLAFRIDENMGTVRVEPKVYGAAGIHAKARFSALYNGYGALNTLDAELVKAVIAGTSTGSLSMTLQHAAFIISNLLFNSTITTGIDGLQSAHVLAALDSYYSVSATAGVLTRELVKIALAAEFDATATPYVRRGAATGANIIEAIEMRAAIEALGRCFTGSRLDMQMSLIAAARVLQMLHSGATLEEQLAISAAAAIKDMAHTGASVSGQFRITVKGKLSAPEHTSVDIQNVSTFTTTAFANLRPQYSAFTLSANSEFTAAVVVPAEIISIFATVSNSFEGTARIRLSVFSSFFIDALYNHAGEAHLSLAEVYTILANIAGQHTGAMEAVLIYSLALKGKLQMVQTGTATLNLATLAFVSELDDVLVSELDDILVTNVEFHIT